MIGDIETQKIMEENEEYGSSISSVPSAEDNIDDMGPEDWEECFCGPNDADIEDMEDMEEELDEDDLSDDSDDITETAITMHKTIVVLAKSYKCGGWCIAGKEVKKLANGKYNPTNTWIRPVSNNKENHGALTDSDCKLINGGIIDVLDLVEIPFESSLPEAGQPENWLVTPDMPWNRETKIDAMFLERLLDKPDDLWVDPTCKDDEVSIQFEEAGLLRSSLYLIQPTDLKIHLSYLFDAYANKEKKEARASFRYNSKVYTGISITDPKIRKMLKNKFPVELNTTVELTLNHGDDYWLCISLGPRFGLRNSHFKLIASIIDKTGYIQRTY